MNLAAEQIAYQQALEAVRTEPDAEDLQANLRRAKAARDQAWLEHTIQR